MHPVGLLLFYCALVVIASLAGGWIPMVVRLTHRRMQMALSFVAGVMMGVGMLHLLPHSFHATHSVDWTVGWAMAGFLVVFFLERFFHHHHHDAPAEDTATADKTLHEAGHTCSLGHDHHHDHAQVDEPHAHPFAWWGAALGLTLHGLIDGVALAAGVVAEQEGNSVAMWAGLGTFLAIFLHKPFDSLTIGTLMTAGHAPRKTQLIANILYALVAPAGVAIFYVYAGNVTGSHATLLGAALGFAAGAFICIAASDLLPELQFHTHDRGTLSVALLAGVVLAWAIVFVESAGHDHHHGHEGHSHAEHGHDHEHGPAH